MVLLIPFITQRTLWGQTRRCLAWKRPFSSELTALQTSYEVLKGQQATYHQSPGRSRGQGLHGSWLARSLCSAWVQGVVWGTGHRTEEALYSPNSQASELTTGSWGWTEVEGSGANWLIHFLFMCHPPHKFPLLTFIHLHGSPRLSCNQNLRPL